MDGGFSRPGCGLPFVLFCFLFFFFKTKGTLPLFEFGWREAQSVHVRRLERGQAPPSGVWEEASVPPGSVSTGGRPFRRRRLTRRGFLLRGDVQGLGRRWPARWPELVRAEGLSSPAMPDSGDGGRVIAGKGNGEGQPPNQEHSPEPPGGLALPC